MKWCGGRGGNIMKGLQFGKGERVVKEKVGWNLGTKLCCIAPGKRNVCRDSLQVFNDSYLILWVILMKWIPVA